jgi:hypothetical protein
MNNYENYTREQLLIIMNNKDREIEQLLEEYKHQTRVIIYTAFTIGFSTLVTYFLF